MNLKVSTMCEYDGRKLKTGCNSCQKCFLCVLNKKLIIF